MKVEKIEQSGTEKIELTGWVPPKESPPSALEMELRFLAMRVVRLIVALIAEVGTLVAMTFMVTCGLLSFFMTLDVITGPPGLNAADQHTYPRMIAAAIAGVIGTVVGFTVVFSVGMPYRYDTKMPGVVLDECGKCHGMTPDFAHCTHCNAPRLSYRGTQIVRVLSFFVTAAWVMHDAFWILMGMTRSK